MVFPFLSKSINVLQLRNNVIFFAVSLLTFVLSPGAACAAGDAVKGQAVFTKNSCVMCHPGGENTMEPDHPIKGMAFLAKYKDDAVLESTIRRGFARDGMPSFSKTAINDPDMKDLIAYVRSLSKAAKNSK